MKVVSLALSHPGRYGRYIFAHFSDRPERRDRRRIYRPKNRQFWRNEGEWTRALDIIAHDLREEGYEVQILPLKDYNELR